MQFPRATPLSILWPSRSGWIHTPSESHLDLMIHNYVPVSNSWVNNWLLNTVTVSNSRDMYPVPLSLQVML